MESGESLRDYVEFKRMPGQIREWIEASPQATADFADFFSRGGTIEPNPEVKFAEYVAAEPPVMRVNEENWYKALAPDAMAWPQRRMMGVLAHEIGHMQFNTGSPLFKGGPPEDFIEYRAGLEAQATLNAFTVFRDLEKLPEFKDDLPYESMGYLQEAELGKLYVDWKGGKIGQEEVIEAIASKVPGRDYTLGNPPPDIDGDGCVTHRDAYLVDYQQMIKARPEMAKRPEEREQVEPARNSRGGPNSVESGGLSKADEALLEQLREQVRELDQKAGKAWDDKSERLAASALVMAKEMGFKAGDDLRLGFNTPTQKHEGGTLLHLVREGAGASIDPAVNRATMTMQDALSQSPQERLQQVEAIGQAQTEQARLARQEEQTRGPEDPTRGGPTRS